MLTLMKSISRPISIIAAAIACCFTFTARAQEAPGKARWGLRAGWDVNLAGRWHKDGSHLPGYHTGTGATLGAICDIPLPGGFFLEPGASLFYDTYADKVSLALDKRSFNTKEIDPTVYKAGIRFSASAGYRFRLSEKTALKVFTGPELSVAFAGGIHINDNDLKEDLDYSIFGTDGYMHRVSAGWKAGAAVPFGNWQAGIDASFGMTNLLTNGYTFRENRLNIHLALFL